MSGRMPAIAAQLKQVKIVECPRDAWQAMPRRIPAEVKANYLRSLIAAGFRHLDAVSFVSPSAVPQMADSEQVLALLAPGEEVEIIAIVVNRQGAERALRCPAVRTLGFPYSLSPTFLARNQRQTPEQSLAVLKDIDSIASSAGLGMVAYLSMAFGNPYGDPWLAEEVIEACKMLAGLGVRQISLADTVGIAGPEQLERVLAPLLRQLPEVEIGVHLHVRPDRAAAMVRAAYLAGCRRLDMALGGLGGCPFAQDALLGNLATEAALAELDRLGAHRSPLRDLDHLLAVSHSIADKFGAANSVPFQ